MNLRSRGSTDLVPQVEDIQRLARENIRARRERERVDHLQRLGMDNPNHGIGPYGNQDHLNEPPDVAQGGVGIHNQGQPQGNQRRIGAFDEPNTRRTRTGIQPPAVAPNNFEIKHSLITMIQNSKFHGLPLENPLDHLDLFDRLCRTVKINGVTEEAIKMILFPFSLGGNAAQWEKNIPSDAVSTWTQVEKEFMGKFFPRQKTAKIRNDIMGFRQGGNESFYEAWERLKGYTRSCPHHGVARDALLGIFHRGVLEKYRNSLDTASRGSFANLSVEEGETLVENLAQSDQTYGSEYDRSYTDSRSSEDKIKELSDKLDKLTRMNQRGVNFVGEVEEDKGEENEEEELCYLQAGFYPKAYNQNYKPYNKLSYLNTDVENPQHQTYPTFKPQHQTQGNYQPKNQFQNQGNYQSNYQPNHPPPIPKATLSNTQPQEDDTKVILRQILEGQGKGAIELSKVNTKIDGIWNDLNARVTSISTHMKTLDNQIAQVASSSKRNGKEILPGKPEENPKDYCNMIFEGIAFEGEDTVSEIESLLGCRVDEKGIIHYDEDEVVIEKGDNGSMNNVKVVAQSYPREEHSMNGNEPLNNSKREAMNVFGHETPTREEKRDSRVDVQPYLPTLPYPQRFIKQKLQDYFELPIHKLDSTTPELKELANKSPVFKAMMDGYELRKKDIEAIARKHGVLPPMQEPRILKKVSNPGKFTLPCLLEMKFEEEALVDTGASVNVISFEMIKRFGIKEVLKPTPPMTLADSTIKRPMGKLEDYPLKVGDCIVPTDFVVVKTLGPGKFSLLLGTPFLETVGTLIDFKKKEVILTNIDPGRSYKMIRAHNEFCGTMIPSNSKEDLVEELDLSESFEWLFDRDVNEDVSKEAFHDKVKKPKGHQGKKGKGKPQLVDDDERSFDDDNLDPRDTPWMSFIPMCYKKGVVEYKIKCKGIPNPFTRAKSVIPNEMIDKGQVGMKHIMTNILKFELVDKGAKIFGGTHSNSH